MPFWITLILVCTFSLGTIFGISLERHLANTTDNNDNTKKKDEIPEDNYVKLRTCVEKAVTKVLDHPYRVSSFIYNEKTFTLYQGELNRSTQLIMSLDKEFFRAISPHTGYDNICRFFEGHINDYFNKEYLEDTKYWEY